MGQEVIRLLQAILELSRADMVCCMMIMTQKLPVMKAFLDISNDIKMDYCNVLLHDNP